MQGTRGRRPWPSCRRPLGTVACTDAPSTMSTARPLRTSASAPRVSLPWVCLASLLREGSSHLQRWCSPWADHSEDSCSLFFFSTQCCQDSSPEKKVKVRSTLGEEWVAFIPAPPSVGGPSPRTWNLFQMPCLPSQTATLCLLVQEMLEEEDRGGRLFQKMEAEVAKGALSTRS